jgi:hypothetical protein
MGSVKDRLALGVIEDAEKTGKLQLSLPPHLRHRYMSL